MTNYYRKFYLVVIILGLFFLVLGSADAQERVVASELMDKIKV